MVMLAGRSRIPKHISHCKRVGLSRLDPCTTASLRRLDSHCALRFLDSLAAPCPGNLSQPRRPQSRQHRSRRFAFRFPQAQPTRRSHQVTSTSKSQATRHSSVHLVRTTKLEATGNSTTDSVTARKLRRRFVQRLCTGLARYRTPKSDAIADRVITHYALLSPSSRQLCECQMST